MKKNDSDIGKDLTFEKIRQIYAQKRRDQKNLLSQHMRNNIKDYGITVSGSQGIGDYTSGRRFSVPYDLSNWQWVNIKRNGRNMIMISLQTFEQDKATKNYHVLMDRLGIFVYGNAKDPRESYREMIPLDIDLPMTDEKLETLTILVKEKLEKENAL